MVQREPFTLASLRDDAASTSPSTTATEPCRIDKVHEEVRADA